MHIVLMGSVSSSRAVLDALSACGGVLTGVLGLDESWADRVCDYQSLREPARAAGIQFCSFESASEPGVERFLRECRPDSLWVIGLSQLVPMRIVDLASDGGVGFHPTPLPRGRGRAPVAWTILRNEPAAATLFRLTAEPDAGDIIAQRPVPVLPDDYSEDLIARTNRVLFEMVLELGPALRSGRLPACPQDDSRATVYPKRTGADGRIDWRQTTDSLYRLVRAAGRPYHGAFTFHHGRKLIVWRARPARADETEGVDAPAPGTVLRALPTGAWAVSTADGALLLTETEFDRVGDGTHEPSLRVGDRLGAEA